MRAHRIMENIVDPMERYLAMGNDLADSAAKDARKRHPVDSPLRQAAWDREWLAASYTAQLIAKVGRLWPAARPPPKVRGRQAAEAAAAQRAAARRDKFLVEKAHLDSHQWTTSRGRTRCNHCGVVAKTRRARMASCPGVTIWKKNLVGIAESQGHALHLALVHRPGEDPHGAFA